MLFSGLALARLLSAVSLILIARQLGPEEFGLYISAFSLAKITSVIFSLGLDSWLLRNGNRDSGGLAKAGTASLILKALLGGFWLIGFILIVAVFNLDRLLLLLVLLSACSLWFDELTNTSLSSFKAALRNNVTVWIMIGSQVLLLVITVFLLNIGIKESVPFLIGRILASIIACVVSLSLSIRIFGFVIVDKVYLHDVFKETIPFGISQGLAVLYERADITIIAFWLGTVAAGLYAPAVSLMTTLFLVPLAIYEVALPIISKIHKENPKDVPAISFRFVLLSALFGIVIGAGMTIIAYPLVNLLYGETYALSGALLTILSAVLVFKSISFALAAVIVAVGWQDKRVIVQIISAAINIGLNILLIQKYGITGVAYVYVLSEAILTLGYMLLVVRWQQQFRVQPIGIIE